jgi:HD superfamily phosphodiesterase
MSEITIETILPYIKVLDRILTTHNVCTSHGTRHAIAVSLHAINALKENSYPITQTESLAIVLAALLHDADDHKFFPKNDNYQNLRSILQSEPETSKYDFIELVVYMVGLVSSSANGDNIPHEIHKDSSYWKLIPRYADRKYFLYNSLYLI